MTKFIRRNSPIFSALSDSGSRVVSAVETVKNIPNNLTINNITVAPTFRYDAGMANTTVWTATVGTDLAITGAGAAPSLSPLVIGYKQQDQGISFNAARCFTAPNNTVGDITTEDFVFNYIARGEGIATQQIMIKIGTGTKGYTVYTTGGKIRFVVYGTSGNATVESDFVSNDISHIVTLDYDASGSAQWHIDGVASGPAVSVSGVGSLTNNGTFFVGGDGIGTYPHIKHISHISLYKRSNWLDTHLQAAASQRIISYFTGSYPSIASGTADPSFSRNLEATQDKILNQTHREIVGPNIIRRERSGYMIGYSGTQLVQRPMCSGWSADNINTPAASTTEYSPWFPRFATKISANSLGVRAADLYLQTGTNITAGSNVVAVAYLKPGEVTTINFSRVYQTSYAHVTGYIYSLVGSGSITGPIEAGYPATTGFVAHVGGGWYKLLYSVASVASTAAPLPMLAWTHNPSSTSAAQFYVGLVNVWVVDHTPADINDHPPLIHNRSVADYTQPTDVLSYVATNNFNSARGTVSFDVTLQRRPHIEDGLLSISKSSSRNDTLEINVDTSGFIKCVNKSGGVTNLSITGNINCGDTSTHNIRLNWIGSSAFLYVDNVLQGTSNTLSFTSGLDKIYCGTLGDGTCTTRKWIKNLKSYNY